jgi:predicted N-formylglutamate amidohydrolase
MDAAIAPPTVPRTRDADDLPAVEVVTGAAASPLVVHCEHAGNAVPARLHNLGLPSDVLERHIAWDIGAGGLCRRLAAELSATAVLSRYSRLVIDLNRPLGGPESIPAASDGVPIPGNRALTPADVAARADAYFWPYHRALAQETVRLRGLGHVPVLISVHSFTPALLDHARARPRPWHCGVLFNRDERFACHLLAELRAVPGLIVGANEPYSGVTHGYCMAAHGLAQGLPHVELEIRQDLICTPAGEDWWAGLLAPMIAAILARPDMREIRHS